MLMTKRLIKPDQNQVLPDSQLNLFQEVWNSSVSTKKQISHLSSLWDAIPRFSVGYEEQKKMRSAEHRLQKFNYTFKHEGQAFTLSISPALLDETETTSDGVEILVSKDYYPGPNEELVEDALRKMALAQNTGFLNDKEKVFGVRFTLYQLRQELKRHGKDRNYIQLMKSLTILSESKITIISENDSIIGKTNQSILSRLDLVSRKEWIENPEATCVAHFHWMLAESITKFDYRQFNYSKMMGLPSQEARWILKYLYRKNTGAHSGSIFKIKLSTIIRDSGLFTANKKFRDTVQRATKVFDELVKAELVRSYEIEKEFEGKKLIDATISVVAHQNFISDQKTANARVKAIQKQQE